MDESNMAPNWLQKEFTENPLQLLALLQSAMYPAIAVTPNGYLHVRTNSDDPGQFFWCGFTQDAETEEQ